QSPARSDARKHTTESSRVHNVPTRTGHAGRTIPGFPSDMFDCPLDIPGTQTGEHYYRGCESARYLPDSACCYYHVSGSMCRYRRWSRYHTTRLELSLVFT